MFLSLLFSFAFAQEDIIQEQAKLYSVSKEAKGVSCVFTEPFVAFKYDFQTKVILETGFGLPATISSGDLKVKQTKNPFIPEYQLIVKGQKTPLAQIYFDNNGSDGMGDEVYPLSVTYAYKDGGPLYGGCFFLNHLGTHIVINTHQEKEPWLNLRSEPSVKGAVIKELYDGTELNVLETNKKWAKVQVIGLRGPAETGWVSLKYIQKRSPK